MPWAAASGVPKGHCYAPWLGTHPPFQSSCCAGAFTAAGALKSQTSLPSTRFPRAVYCLYLRPFHQLRQASSHSALSTAHLRAPHTSAHGHLQTMVLHAPDGHQSPTVCSEQGWRTLQAPGTSGGAQKRRASCPAPHCVCTERLQGCVAGPCPSVQDTVCQSRTPRVTAHTTLGTVPKEGTAHCRACSVPGVQ